MAILGILILLAVGIATATVISNGDDPATVNMVGFDIRTNLTGIYAIGALNLLLVMLGLFLVLGGAKRARRKRKEVKSLRREADSEPASVPDRSREAPADSGHQDGHRDGHRDDPPDRRETYGDPPRR